MIDTLVVVDDNNVIQTVNSSLCAMLGYKESELVNQPFTIILEEPSIMVTGDWDRFLAGGILRDFEMNYLTKSGERIPMNFTGAIMEDKRRGIRSIVGVAHDMREILRLMKDLERRRNETEQARNEADTERHRLMSLLSSISEGVLMFDPQGEVVVANPYARRLFRLPAETHVTRDVLRAIGWLNIDELMDDVLASPHKSLYREVDINFPIPQVIRIATSRVLAADGRELGLVMVLHDVTEERQMDRLRDEFVATVSHDLRTPLTSIKGFVALLLGGKAGKLEDKQREFLKHVEESAVHLHSLINDLLDLSRIRAGKLLMQVENMDIRRVVEESVRMNHHAAENKNLKLTTDLTDEPCMADVDFERMKEVLNNLISNSIKFTPEGGEIEVSLTGNDVSCEIKVKDTGVGIPREHQAIIFDKFRSVPRVGEETSLSTGLGLSIVKGIVEAHHGRVWVESEPGKGSAFHVNLPRKFEA
jgi:two-component system phosphate regulon sensor histidine kinase PhoR